MYIHKIVIDANCINARGTLQEMNQLEAYHDAGVVELLKTSTLIKEFSNVPFFKKKAENFQTIGGRSFFSGLDGGHPEAIPGGIIGNPMLGLFEKLFPDKKTDKDLHRSLRDSLHIEQAILNYCDYFVTNEKRLKEGSKKIPEIADRISVTSPMICLDEIKAYFLNNYGSADPQFLEHYLNTNGPITLGSHTLHGFHLIDSTTREPILSASVENNKVLIKAVFYDDKGIKQLEISPGDKSVFASGDLRIACGGRGGIVIGEKAFNHFMVGSEEEINLAARVMHSGCVTFFIVKMNGPNPQNYISVDKSCLTLGGVVFA